MNLNTMLAEKLLNYYKKSGNSKVSLKLLNPLVEEINEDGAAYALGFILEHNGKVTKRELEKCKDPWLVSKLILLKEKYGLIEVINDMFIISNNIINKKGKSNLLGMNTDLDTTA